MMTPDSADNVRAKSDRPAGQPAMRGPETDEPFIVGVGASADGLPAMKSFFSALPDEPGMVFVVAQHLQPDTASELQALLQRTTAMEVEEAADGTSMRPNHVYVLPPGKQLSIDDGELRLREMPELESGRTTIDFLFRSLAEHRGERAVGVLLSGAGSDGTTGLRLIKEHGGVTMAQSPKEAGFDEMPRSAINAEVVDVVASTVDLSDRVAHLPSQRRTLGPLSTPRQLDEQKRERLDGIMAKLRDETGTDLSEYKRPTVLRRVARRMQVRDVETLEDYDQLLERDSDELEALFDELLIGVTSFFRDSEVWETLRDDVIPQLFDDKGSGDEIRIWVPGCSTGEEAYSLTMLVMQHADELRDPPDIKVFATDIDHEAIETARTGEYPAAITADVPADLMSRYFRAIEGKFKLVKSVRRKVMFATQNVLTDPPFSNIDLASCRNLLIYLESDAQDRLLEVLHYSLREDGFLLLGESETPTQRPELFESGDRGHHIYRPAKATQRQQTHPRRPFDFEPVSVEPEEFEPSEGESSDLEQRHKEALLTHFGPRSVLVDREYRPKHVVGDLHPYLALRPGKAPGDVLELCADDLQPHLRSLLREVFDDGEVTIRRNLDVQGESVAVQALPVDADLVALTFRPTSPVEPGDETASEEPGAAAEHFKRELEETRNRLQATIRKYESTNEKLRASNEELVSMNEELQSTTEETFIDITDRKQTEDELARSEQKFRTIFEQAVDAMVLFPLEDDGQPGTFQEVNETAADKIGVSPEELEQMSLDDVLGGPDFDLDAHLDQLEATGEAGVEALLRTFDDREPVPVEVRARLMEFEDEPVVVELMHDITDRKRYKEAIIGKERAEQLAEMRSMFLSTLSHDVRSPLSGIVTMIGVLRRQLGDEYADALDRIERSSNQLRKILDSILRMARLDSHEALAEPEDFDLIDEIEDIADLHEPLADQKGLDFEYEGLERPVEVRLDPRFLAQILNNLLDNAVKYTDQGGVTLRLETNGDWVRIQVEDTGPGIPEDFRERIFERAETGPVESDEDHSEGLGLAITKQLTEEMNGIVSVESEEGEGSTFTVEFPRTLSVETGDQ